MYTYVLSHDESKRKKVSAFIAKSTPDVFVDFRPPYWWTKVVHQGPSRTRGQNCLLMSKICHRNEKPSATGLFTEGQNLVADGQTSKMPSTTSGAGQTESNLGKQ